MKDQRMLNNRLRDLKSEFKRIVAAQKFEADFNSRHCAQSSFYIIEKPLGMTNGAPNYELDRELKDRRIKVLAAIQEIETQLEKKGATDV